MKSPHMTREVVWNMKQLHKMFLLVAERCSCLHAFNLIMNFENGNVIWLFEILLVFSVVQTCE